MRKFFQFLSMITGLLVLLLANFGTYTNIQAAATATQKASSIGTLAINIVDPSGGAGQVILVDTNGKNLKPLDIKAPFGPVIWSPDGKSLAFADAQFGVTIVNADGSNPQTVKGASGGAFGWTSDSKQLTVVSGLTVSNLDLATGQSQALFKITGAADGHVTSLRWSPDGKELAYVLASSGSNDIHIIDATGSNDQVVVPATDGSANLLPMWSTDSQKFAYMSYVDQSIYTVDLATKAKKTVIKGIGWLAADWSPDGSQFAYAGPIKGTGASVNIISANGGKPQSIALPTSVQGIPFSISWRPPVTDTGAGATGASTAEATQGS